MVHPVAISPASPGLSSELRLACTRNKAHPPLISSLIKLCAISFGVIGCLDPARIVIVLHRSSAKILAVDCNDVAQYQFAKIMEGNQADCPQEWDSREYKIRHSTVHSQATLRAKSRLGAACLAPRPCVVHPTGSKLAFVGCKTPRAFLPQRNLVSECNSLCRLLREPTSAPQG